MPLAGMPLPAVQRNIFEEIYGEIATIYEIAVHFLCIVMFLRAGGASPSPTVIGSGFAKTITLQNLVFRTYR